MNKNKHFRPRLPNHDYSSPGLYFITIDCYRMECHFVEILKGNLIPSDFGKIAFEQWNALSSRFPHFESHIFQIMPNHLHAIVEIKIPEPKLTVHQNSLFLNRIFKVKIDSNSGKNLEAKF